MLPQRLRELRTEKKLTQDQMAEKLGITRPAYTAYELGKRQPDYEGLTKIARIFDVSTDYLLGNSDKRHYYDLTEKDEKDIAKQAQNIIHGIDTKAGLSFYGEPATEEQLQSMRDIIETGLRINREKAKKKFTPKKYRDRDMGGD